MEDDKFPSKRYAPEELDLLCRRTGFERQQIKALYRAFKQTCPTGAINEATFKSILCQLFPLTADANAYGHYLFKALDLRQSGNLTFSDLICGFSCLVKGNMQERLHWIFRLYDINRDGEISRKEMYAIVGAIHDLVGPNRGKSEKHANHIFQKIDLNSDGVITMDEFMTFCFNNETTFKSLQSFANL